MQNPKGQVGFMVDLFLYHVHDFKATADCRDINKPNKFLLHFTCYVLLVIFKYKVHHQATSCWPMTNRF